MENATEYLPGSRVVFFEFTPHQILGLADTTAEVARIIEAMADGINVVISTSQTAENLSKTLILAEEMNIPRPDASRHASQLLANITREVLAQVPAKLILSGGETANVICKTIGARSLQVTGQIETSIPLMIDEQARWIITKSGGFGSAHSLLSILKALRTLESRDDTFASQ